jgi:hypothetical protein
MSLSSSQAGFTLLETVVAFAITSGTLALLYQIHAQATHAIALADEYGRVTELAQSLLAEASGTADGAQVDKAGVAEDTFRWRARSELYESLSAPGTSHPSRSADDFTLRRVVVEISWGTGDRERTFSLETLKPLIREIDGAGR